MTLRTRKSPKSTNGPSPLAAFKATVCVERNGASVRVDDVPADQAFNVLAEMLLALRLGTDRFPELVAELAPVGGYTAVTVDESAYGGRSRVGF